MRISVTNTSTDPPTLCGAGGAGCAPFLVHYTVDGSEPSAGAPLACAGWREDECREQWDNHTLVVFGSMCGVVRAVAVRTGLHSDTCQPFGAAPAAGLPPDSAALVCNAASYGEGNTSIDALDAPDLVLEPAPAAVAAGDASEGFGDVLVSISTEAIGGGGLMAENSTASVVHSLELVYELCVVVPPLTNATNATCAPAELSASSPRYLAPLRVQQRAMLRAGARSTAPGGGIVSRIAAVVNPKP